MSPASSLSFSGEQDLEPGDNDLWVMYELSDEANLHHKVDGACEKSVSKLADP